MTVTRTKHQISPQKCGVIVNKEVILSRIIIHECSKQNLEKMQKTHYAFTYGNKKYRALGLAPQMGLVQNCNMLEFSRHY